MNSNYYFLFSGKLKSAIDFSLNAGIIIDIRMTQSAIQLVHLKRRGLFGYREFIPIDFLLTEDTTIDLGGAS